MLLAEPRKIGDERIPALEPKVLTDRPIRLAALEDGDLSPELLGPAIASSLGDEGKDCIHLALASGHGNHTARAKAPRRDPFTQRLGDARQADALLRQESIDEEEKGRGR